MEMDNNKSGDIEKQNVKQYSSAPFVTSDTRPSAMVVTMRRTIIWANIFMAMVCGFISLMAIWFEGMFNYDVLSKVWLTFLTFASVSIFIATLSPLLDRNK